jgi:hypothetical protein
MSGESVLGGFEAVTQAITNNVGSQLGEGVSNEPSQFTHDVIREESEKIEESIEQPIEDPIEDPVEDPIEEEEEIIEDPKPEEEEIENPEEAEELSFGETEPELAKVVHEQLLESLGWEPEEGAEELTSISEVVDYMKGIIEENSVPEYANDELRNLDEYVRNGGEIRNFLSDVYGTTDYDTIDVTEEKNQKVIVKEHLKTKGYTDARINRMVSRYEDAGTLEEEAEDALDMLKEYKQSKSEELLENQKNQRKGILEQQQKYVSDVQTTIDDISDIRGIPLSKQEKSKLLNYIFKPTTDGQTQYQKDYLKNNKNLIESAYFTMKGDTLVDKVKRKATSEAARNLKKRLAEKGKRTKDQSSGQDKSSTSSIWGLASGQLRKPN